MTKEKVVYEYSADTKNMNSNLSTSEKRFSGVTKKALLLGTAIVAAGAGMFKMADMASDLNESMNVVTQVFGDSADEIVKWSEGSIKAMGLSQTQALKTAGTYGAMATAQGLSNEQAVDMAKTLTQLSADMASFYNVSQDVASTALKGVLTGETESLKQFGIMIDVNTLKQYGYEESMSQSEKMMVRYKAVMAQTEKVQGDFANTSDGLANQTRILTEQFKDLLTKIGQKLIPFFEKLTKALNSGLGVAIALVTGETKDLTDKQLAMYTTIQNVGTAISNLVTDIVGLVQQVSGFLIPLWEQFSKIMTSLVIPAISALIQGFVSFLLPIIQAIIPFVQALWSGFQILAGIVISLAQQIAVQLAPILGKIIIIFVQVMNALRPVAIAFYQVATSVVGLVVALGRALAPVISVIITVLSVLIDILITTLGPVFVLIANIISTVLVVAFNVLQVIINVITSIINVLATVFEAIGRVAEWLGAIIQAVLAGAFVVLEAIVSPFIWLFQEIGDLFNFVGKKANELSKAIQDKLAGALDFLKKPLDFIIDKFNDFLGIIDRVKGAVSGLGDKIGNAFKNIPFIGGGNKSVNVGYSGQTQGGLTGNTTSTTNYNYNITQNKSNSLRELKMQQLLFKNRGGYYAN